MKKGLILRTSSGEVGIVWDGLKPVSLNGIKQYSLFLVDENYDETGKCLLVNIKSCKRIGIVE